MSTIQVKENESLDSALKRFKRSCAKSGVLADLRKKEYYQSPSVKRRKKSVRTRTSATTKLIEKLRPDSDGAFFFSPRSVERKAAPLILFLGREDGLPRRFAPRNDRGGSGRQMKRVRCRKNQQRNLFLFSPPPREA